MVAYISLINWTEQGVKGAKDTVKRAQAAKQAASAMGGRFIGIWWTLGAYDMVAVIEAPDEDSATRLLINIAGQGNIRTMTMRAFSEDEMGRIVQGLP
jgi:uncharacterized protein with GYD domain